MEPALQNELPLPAAFLPSSFTRATAAAKAEPTLSQLLLHTHHSKFLFQSSASNLALGSSHTAPLRGTLLVAPVMLAPLGPSSIGIATALLTVFLCDYVANG
jgi:hypothetical protein